MGFIFKFKMLLSLSHSQKYQGSAGFLVRKVTQMPMHFSTGIIIYLFSFFLFKICPGLRAWSYFSEREAWKALIIVVLTCFSHGLRVVWSFVHFSHLFCFLEGKKCYNNRCSTPLLAPAVMLKFRLSYINSVLWTDWRCESSQELQGHRVCCVSALHL